MAIDTISYSNGRVKLIDQTKLPNKLTYIYCSNLESLIAAIKRLSVRGAPALGVAAGFGVLLCAERYKGKSRSLFDKHIYSVCAKIASSRPTAVNLFNALGCMKDVLVCNNGKNVKDIKKLLKAEAIRILEEDKRVCRIMGELGEKLIKNNANVLTICNAGALATADFGTALGVFYQAKKKKKKFKVYACETRPLLQGARLTAWELLHEKIDTTLICDSMAASLMKEGKVDAVFTGADRIASNGDSANKIGTYNLAVLAKYHKIPFYIVAPKTTFDLNISTGKDIVIEQRHKTEVTFFRQVRTAPKNVKVYNPAFDVTDAKLITAIITEFGIIYSPTKRKIAKILKVN